MVGFNEARPATIWVVGGDVIVFWRKDGSHGWRDFSVGHSAMPMDEVLRVKSDLDGYIGGDPTWGIRYIPIYYLLSAYLAMWAGLLIWRKRKYEQRPVE